AIRGRIVDGSGAPVPNASIVALRYDRHVHLPTEPPRAAAVSDADGRFRIDPAALEDPTPLLFARTGDLAGVRIVQDSDASSDPFELRVEPSKAMELRVVDTDGQPVEGATASAFPFVESMISPVDSAGDICDAVDALAYVHLFGARTDAAGRARIEGLPTSVAADAFGVLGVTHPAFVRHSDIVRWDRDESVVELRVRLSPARSFPLAGRVVDARGRGVSGALLTVAAEEPEAVADGTGAFTFDGLSPHAFPISVRCAAQGFEGDVRRITFADVGDPSFRLEFALRPLAVRHGRVVDESGQPVAGAEILSASTASTQQTVTGDDGTFCVEAGDGRALSIVAAVPSEADSPLAGVSRAVDVSPGASSFDVTLETPRARVPRVVFELVEATTGAPVDIERVALCSERGTVWTRVEVGGHRVVAEDVPAGLWSVFASVTAAESEGLLRLGHMSFEVSSEPGGPLRVPVFAPGYIELDVSDLRARGTDGVSVFACSHGTQLAPLWFYAGEANCETAQRSAFPESGPLVLGPLVHGTYTITSEGRSVLEDGSGIDPIRVDVVGGETVRARLVAGPSGVVRLDAPKSALRGRHDLEARRLPGGEWFVAARFGRRANEERSNEQSMPVGEYEWRYSQLMQDEHGDLRAVSPEAHGRFIVREGRTTRVRLGPADQVRPPKSSAE
ncbi:MAG: carboxypeptidase-like regulatory domain-containing protein, partial [Planctomycetota bacterium]